MLNKDSSITLASYSRSAIIDDEGVDYLRVVCRQRCFGRILSCYLVSNAPIATDVLLVTADSGLVSAITVDPSLSEFICLFQLQIAKHGLNHCELGHMVACDRLSNYMAISAFQHRLTVWPTEYVEVNSLFVNRPIAQNASNFTFDGIVCAMQFVDCLCNGVSEFSLVVAVCKARTLSLIVFNISSGKSIQPFFRIEDSVALHLIPLKHLVGCFVLVTETDIYLFNLEDGTGSNLSCRISNPTDASKGLNGLISSYVWVPPSNGHDECLLLASDQGHLMLLHLAANMAEIELVYINLGGKKSQIASMIALDTSNTADLSVLLFNSFCDTKLLRLDLERFEPRLTHFPSVATANTGPATDMCIADAYGTGNDAIYYTSGIYPHGRINEIVQGVDIKVDVSAPGFKHATNIWSLPGNPVTTIDRFLVVSFVAETRIMAVEDTSSPLTNGLLDDITDSSGINKDVLTLNMGRCTTTGRFIQVSDEALCVCDPYSTAIDDIDLWKPPMGSHIGLSDFFDTFVVLTLTNPDKLVVLDITAHSDGIRIVKSIDLDAQPSCLYCSPIDVNGTRICVLGTFESTLQFYSLDSVQNLGKISLLQYSDEKIGIPNSIRILQKDQYVHLLVGLRDGSLLHFPWKWNKDKFLHSKPVITKLSQKPLNIITSGRGDTETALLLAKTPWRVSISDRHGGVTISPVLFGEMATAAPFRWNENDNNDSYFIISSDELSFVSINRQSSLCKRIIKTYDTPRRILFDNATGCLIVSKIVDESDCRMSQIDLIDPKTKVTLATAKLKANEVVYSLLIWHIQSKKRYLCVGTGLHDTSSSELPKSGRLLVYGLLSSVSDYKRANKNRLSFLELELKRETTLDGVVSAISMLCNSYLLVSSGGTLFRMKIDRDTRSMTVCNSTNTGSVITRIRSVENRIAVSNARDSTSVYEYSNKKFTLLFSDGYSRPTSDCILLRRWLGQSLVVSSDRTGTLFALSAPKPNSLTESMSVAACFDIGEPVMRLQTGALSHRWSNRIVFDNSHVVEADEFNHGWFSSSETKSTERFSRDYNERPDEETCDLRFNPHGKRKSSSQQEGPILNERTDLGAVIYALTVSGSVYSVIRLKKDVYIILSVLQTVMSVNHKTKPLLGNDYYSSRSSNFPMVNTIDGEFLLQFKDLDEECKIEIMAEFSQLHRKMTVVEMDKLLTFVDVFST